MPILKRESVDLPYAGRRYTPNMLGMAELYRRTGESLANLSLRKGEIAAGTLGKLGALYSNFREEGIAEQARKEALALKREEAAARKAEQDADRAEREAERKAVRAERTQLQAERRGAAAVEDIGGYGPIAEDQVDDVMQSPAAGRTRYAFGPGTAEGPEVTPTPEQQRGITMEKAVQSMGGIIGPNGQIVMPPKPAPKSIKLEPAMVNGQRTFVQFATDPATGLTTATDFRGQPVDAKPIAPQGPTREPEKPSVWLQNGKQKRFVTPSEAAIMSQQGWTQPAGAEKPSSGVQKRVLNFFNRAEQADKELENLEPEIAKLGLAGQAWQAIAPNFAQTQLGQSYTAAQRAFTEARLRKDSGAAIPESEFENDRRTYFVQPGDSEATIAQKNRARAAILSSLAFESGQALGEFLGDADEAEATIGRYKARSAGTSKPSAKPDPLGIRK